jgi:hypothetical protein
MRTVLVALALALVSLPAFAEGLQTTNRSEEQQKNDKEADAAYKAMTKQLPDKPRNTDPWAVVRTNEAAATTTPAAGAAPTHHQATAKKPKHPANSANSAN